MFEHFAQYNDSQGRVEMYLAAPSGQVVNVDGQSFELAAGEAICTEYSHKYSMDGFAKMAAACGWNHRDTWTDDRQYFAVMYLER